MTCLAYRNGRKAKPGDKVTNLHTGQTGILYDLSLTLEPFNGRVAPISPQDYFVIISDCVHFDDIVANFPPPAPNQDQET
jgi:hypothetical protein